MSYVGDMRLGDTFDVKFCTVTTTGAPTTLAGSPVISAYPGNSTTQLTAGITLSVDFDTVTGLNNVRVVATSGNGYATATDYQLVITTGTVGGVSVVGYVIGEFSIEKRSALMPTTAARTLDVTATGEGGVDWSNVGAPTTALALTGTTIAVTQKVDVDTIKTNPVVNGGTITFPTTATLASTTNITAGTVAVATAVTTVNGLAANVITATSIAADAITDAKVAADVTIASVTGAVGSVTGAVGSVTGAVGSVTGAVGSVTGNVGGNVTGSVGSVVGAVGSVTGNVGGNVVGSVASVVGAVGSVTGLTAADVGAIKAKTDNLPSDPADQSLLEAAILAAWTTALTESYSADGAAPTPAQALMLIMQRLTEFAITGTTITVNKLDGTTAAATLTLDDATSPTSSTRAT